MEQVLFALLAACVSLVYSATIHTSIRDAALNAAKLFAYFGLAYVVGTWLIYFISR